MRTPLLVVLLGGCLGCGSNQPTAARGTAVTYAVADQTETQVCESPVTPQATCTVTLTARVVLGELEGHEWRIRSIQSSVRDGRSGQDLHALPTTLTADQIQRAAGTNVLQARGSLEIPVQVQFLIGQAPYYIDGPHELKVTLFALVN